MTDPIREALLDATAHLAGAASAYRTYAKRAAHLGKVAADPFFTTRANDFDGAVERARAALAAPVAQPLTDEQRKGCIKDATGPNSGQVYPELLIDLVERAHGIGSKP